MKKIIMLSVCFILSCFSIASAEESAFDTFLTQFNYETRVDMKIDDKELIKLLIEKKAVLVDIRFKEETKVWGMGFGLKIPLNELPKRLAELPKDKLIVTACPHIDRSGIAMTYLRTQGYNARYLVGGLTGLAENLRGDKAKSFMEKAGIGKP